ncbi:MAG: hypothetical protein JWP08_4099 [Bryobacterales bacterium]|nr:hypothetical protein [Bryobacterales bacterium]
MFFDRAARHDTAMRNQDAQIPTSIDYFYVSIEIADGGNYGFTQHTYLKNRADMVVDLGLLLTHLSHHFTGLSSLLQAATNSTKMSPFSIRTENSSKQAVTGLIPLPVRASNCH